MKGRKKLLTLVLSLALFCCTMGAHAQEYIDDTNGNAYCTMRNAPSLAPAIALGTGAIVAIIAVALQNSGGGGHHNHSHD
jgi:hypothetical protein